MKKRLLLLFFMVLAATISRAQLAPGSTAPNLTINDLANGLPPTTLYELLDQGKTVYLDFFATWCGPCWNYHNGHALRTIWETYGPDGTDEAYVVSVEADPSTNIDCIFGPSGCNSTTQGDWTAGTPYAIINDDNSNNTFNINYFPTIYIVCPGPDRKIYETGQLSASGLWNYRNTNCDLSVSLEQNFINHVVCYGSNTGAISVSASGGFPPYTYHWSNGVNNTTGSLNNIPAGTYACTVTSSNGTSSTLSDLVVEGPSAPITVEMLQMTQPGCNGLTGSLLVQASGGWQNGYTYNWSNGQFGEEVLNLSAGTYTVSVTDDQGCQKTQSFQVTQAPPPVIAIVPPTAITCASPSIQINASGSSSNGNQTYNWFASNGGHIVSGANSLTPVVDAAGTYALQIIDNVTTCSAFGNTSVTANLAVPTSNAGPTQAINCNQSTVTLQGSGSSGSGFSYLWTAANGGNIVSGAGSLSPVVNAAGTYTLKVTNTANGCTSTSTTTVSGNSTALSVQSSGGTLTCTAPSVALNVANSGAGITYEWTGPNGFSSQAQNPTVAIAGTYTVVVSDPSSGCTGSSVAAVVANNAAPGASATGGTITCNVNTLAISGNTTAPNTVYTWSGPGGFSSNMQNPIVSMAGTYNLLVTDTLNGCGSAASAIVDQNTVLPVAAAVSTGNLNCNNVQIQLNGTASSQGNNFSYAWSGGSIVSGNNTLTPLVNQAATYTLLVTNANNGCTNSTQVIVNQSEPVSASLSAASVSCNGGSNGSATAVLAGGNGTYTYLWSNGASTATIENLAAGSYGLIVTDGEGCSALSTVMVGQPALLVANASATPQTANGTSDGTATTSVIGGTAGYTYLWSTGETTSSINGLAPGTYTVSVTDANGCMSTEVVTVNAFNCALAASVSANNVSCFGGNNGSANITLTGAADPVSYNWSNGASTAALSDLTAGAYTVMIMDGNNCPSSLNVTITQPLELSVNATATQETASGANDGTATAAPVGGTNPYAYIWSNGSTTMSVLGLAPGIYTVSITDANGCASSQSVTINSFDCAIATETSVLNVSCNGLSNGSATVVLNGGAAPFVYAWSNGASTPTISDLNAGTYSVAVTDDNGCVVETSVTITEPFALSAAVLSVTNTICTSDLSGSINIGTTGGTPGYTYLWNTGATTPNLTNIGAGNYSLVVTDANGCSQSTAAQVVSNDLEAPVVTADNATVEINNDGVATVTTELLNVTATDNCEVGQVSLNSTTFDCSQLGTHVVVVTVADGAGNVSTTTAQITVVDKIIPTVSCPTSITRCPGDNLVSYPSPTATDNCLAGGIWNQVSGLPSGSEFPVGVTTQTFSFADLSGNTGFCAFDVIITEPAILSTAVTNANNGQSNGAIDLTVTGGNAPFTYAWTQNDQAFSTEEDLQNIPAGTYQVIVTDANGCVYHTASIQVTNAVSAFEPSWLNRLSIRPNPTSGLASLVFGETPTETVTITIVDATGRFITEMVSDGQQRVQIDLQSMPSGMYYIRISTQDFTTGRRLVVER